MTMKGTTLPMLIDLIGAKANGAFRGWRKLLQMAQIGAQHTLRLLLPAWRQSR